MSRGKLTGGIVCVLGVSVRGVHVRGGGVLSCHPGGCIFKHKNVCLTWHVDERDLGRLHHHLRNI